MITEDIIQHCHQHKYSHAYRDYWLAHPQCEISTCAKWAGAPHHIRSRGAGGSDEPGNFLSLCPKHHTEIHFKGWLTFGCSYPSLLAKLETAKGKRYEKTND